MEEKTEEKQLQIELPADMAEGVYSNFALIAHSQAEFVLDFVRLLPGTDKAKVKARVLVTPQHAKRLVQALMENIRKYESVFGKIKEPEAPVWPSFMNITPAEA